jgi:predicted ATP-grasp superfamily ATP-dependent carboligase
MSDKRKPVAVVSGLEMSGYGITRSLGRAGVRVVAFTDGVDDFGRSSRYCHEYASYPAARDEERTCEMLLEWSARCDEKPVLFVTSDWFALFLAKHQERLAARYHFHWVPSEIVERMTNKARISQFCEQRGVRVPRLYYPQPGHDLAAQARDFPFPCLVKVVRHFDRDALPHVDLTIFHSATDLLELYRRHPELRGKTFWQQIIEGSDDNVYECNILIRDSGDVGGVCCVRRLRQYPPRFGMMSYGRSEENEFVIAETLRLLRLLDYRGLANVEFRYQPVDGRYYFIEVNPRLPWSTSLFADAGINLAHRAYLDLTREEGWESPPTRQRNGIYALSFNHDIGWYFRTRREGRNGLWPWLASLPKARSHAWWDWRDPLPGLGAGLHLLRIGSRKLFAGSRASRSE